MRVVSLLVVVGLAVGCSGGGPAAPPAARPTTPPATPPTTPPATGAPAPTPSGPPLPRSMAALGDSMTRAFLVCGTPADCPEASWATGTRVDSHAARLERLAGRPVETHNLAVSGARVADLPAQATAAVRANPGYVTVLVGANDACRPSTSAMTSEDDFAASFRTALATLAQGLPKAPILVVSIPDLQRLWDVGRADEQARATWDRYGVCRSALAPDAPRARVRDRIRAYNTIMANLCARYPSCRWDGEAVFRHRFVLADVSPLDYWHPGRQGQETLADVTWRAGFWPTRSP